MRITPFSVCCSREGAHHVSKNGKLKKAKNVEKRRLQMEEALECIPMKEAAEYRPLTLVKNEPSPEEQRITVARTEPKHCSFEPCGRYVDPSCTACPYCGHPL